jgi:hypothetical protein
LAGNHVQLGFLDGRIVAELEITRLQLGPVAADMPRIERDANALQRPDGIVRGRLRFVVVRQGRAGAVAGGELEREERLALAEVGKDFDPFVVDGGVVPKRAVGRIDLVDEARKLLPRDRPLISIERSPIRRRRQRGKPRGAGGYGGHHQAEDRPAQKAKRRTKNH